MTLYFLDDVFRLNLALKPPQRVFERLAFLHSNLCQGKYTSKSSQLGRLQNSAQSAERNCFLCQFAIDAGEIPCKLCNFLHIRGPRPSHLSA